MAIVALSRFAFGSLSMPRPSGTGTRLLAYSAVFIFLSTLLRAALSLDLRPDDAELTVDAQDLRGGYADQPPLYTWVLRGVNHVTGPGFVGLAVIRAVLLLALVGLMYTAAQTLVPDRRLHVPVALSPLLIPTFAWHAATYLTHSLLLSVAVMATVVAVARIVRDGRTRDYLLLGAAVALGVYAKYNFALAVLAAGVAGLTVPAARARLLDRRMVLAVGGAFLLLLPHLVWLAEWHGEVLWQIRIKANRAESPPYWVGVGRGLAAGFTTFWLCTVVVAPVLWLVGRNAPRLEPADPVVSWLGRFLLGMAVIHVALVFACGVTRFADRWLQPLLLPLPVWYLARLAPGAASAVGLLVMNRAHAVLLATILLAQVGQLVFVDRLPAGYDLRLDFPTLARELESAGYANATIIGMDREILGNLHVHMPGARLIHANGTNVPERPAGLTVVVWDKKRWGDAPPRVCVPESTRDVTPLNPDPASVRTFTLASCPPCRRPVTLLVYELPER